jgi:hypothetical protein
LGKRCGYCHNFGHTEDECWRKKKHQEEDAESSDRSRSQSEEKKKAPCSSHKSDSDLDGEEAKFTTLFPEFFSHKWEENSSIHYF